MHTAEAIEHDGQEIDPREELESFLTGTLRATYLPFSIDDLRFEAMRTTRQLRDPEQTRQSLEYLAYEHPEFTGDPTGASVKADLADFDGYLASIRAEYQERAQNYARGVATYMSFTREHPNVVGYIVDLAVDRASLRDPGDEAGVANALKRLSNLTFMGPMGYGQDQLSTSLGLASLIQTAATEHAARTGQNVDEYLANLVDDEFTVLQQ